eukprot:15430458-Alexandrium_andersonii.AAC.3
MSASLVGSEMCIRDSPCNKVMIAQVDVNDNPLSLDGKILIQEGQAVVYPVWWTDAATDNFQTRFKEITYEIEDVIKDLPQDGFLDAILAEVRAMGNAPGYFEKMGLAPQALALLEEHNKDVLAGRRNRSVKQWGWGHLLGVFSKRAARRLPSTRRSARRTSSASGGIPCIPRWPAAPRPRRSSAPAEDGPRGGSPG